MASCEPSKGKHVGGTTITHHGGYRTITCNTCKAVLSQAKEGK